ncbi:DUF2975 domain-containing protein [Kordiimonas sp. SCSIO 12603]|uniref:DUF2975 domain-containing protein n=1 Tax=Kordiimonas sp. SCSIO 12603 TaxID=2829596 RepID=UPI0021035840|nr:DUF2975 domain-containing protein [Kordiimonas sp. SCSIO 12603]UTW58770.1 DUF2975 domain-containing protein [Kordiimonas sp. SCSIO 12603]
MKSLIVWTSKGKRVVTENRVRIQKLSRRLNIVAAALLYGLPVLTLLYWISFNYLPENLNVWASVPNQPISIQIGLQAFAAALVPLSPVLYGLINLRRWLGYLKDGTIFIEQTAQCLRSLGFALMFLIITNIIFDVLISLILTQDNGSHLGHYIELDIYLSDFFPLFLGGVIVLISRVIHEAVDLQQEQSLTI